LEARGEAIEDEMGATLIMTSTSESRFIVRLTLIVRFEVARFPRDKKVPLSL
jgi:hypothetical protein